MTFIEAVTILAKVDEGEIVSAEDVQAAFDEIKNVTGISVGTLIQREIPYTTETTVIQLQSELKGKK